MEHLKSVNKTRARFLSVSMFLLMALLLLVQSLFASDQEPIVITGADEMWTVDIATIPADAVDATDAAFTLPNEAVLCHADEVWNYDFGAVGNGLFDASSASFTLPNEAVICHADEVMTGGLDSVNVGNGLHIQAKMPVLFVPGLLGTQIKDGDNLVWINDAMFNPFNSDDFMDTLNFNGDLLPVKGNLLLAGVLKEKNYSILNTINFHYDYSDGLIKEFEAQGYDAIDGDQNQDFFTFPYDWRYGVSGLYPAAPGVCEARTNTTLLKEKIDQILAQTHSDKIDIIAHSMGGLIVKKYIIDNGGPKIDKLVFVGVPNLGAPQSAKALLNGDDFKVFGLNPDEIKKISRNMPAAYDLLPGESYFGKRGGYLTQIEAVIQPTIYFKTLDYGQTYSYLNQRLNSTALANARTLRETGGFDNYDIRNKVAGLYNIVGCKSATIGLIFDSKAVRPPQDLISGDDTVPFESADSITADNDKTFYVPLVSHGKMPSDINTRKMILSIVAGTGVPGNIISYSTLKGDPSLCELDGNAIEIHSPVDITLTDGVGNIVLGVDGDGNTHYDIPGASFEIIDGHKYVYLPSEYKNQYNINLKGSGTGTFTLIDKKIEGDTIKSAEVFNDLPVTPSFGASLEISGGAARIITDRGPAINPTSEITGGAAADALPPQTAATINGKSLVDFYNTAVAVNLRAADFAQDGAVPAGVFSISYRLDNNATSTVKSASTTIVVSGQGKHNLVFFAGDKLGNKEEPKTVSFVIDQIPPELQFKFDQDKKDLVFSAADNYSASNTIAIVDQNGAVTAADQAGNMVRLSFNEKDRRQSLRAQLAGLSYNGKTIDMSGNQLAFAWFYGYAPKIPLTLIGLQALPAIPATLPKTGPLSFLLQQAKLKDGSFIAALYGNGKTLVLEYKNKKLGLKTFSGLRLVDFATNGGMLEWSY